MGKQVVHLHTHSDFSTLDGMVNVPDLVARAASYGQKAMALTDHGSVAGLPLFIKECEKHNMKPILGCEFYFSMGNPDDKVMHLIIYAKNLEGYYHLINLNNVAWQNSVKGMFGAYRGVLTYRHLKELGTKNLIAQTACMAGPMSRTLSKGEDVVPVFNALSKVFDPGHFFLELQDHKMEEEAKIMRSLEEVARDHDWPTVMTTDIHYLNADQKFDHTVYMTMQFKKTIDDLDAGGNRGVGYHVMTREEMDTFNFHKDTVQKSLDNTLEIASMIETVTLKDVGAELPKFKFPFTLDELVLPRLQTLDKEYHDRALYELKVIKKLGFEDYFLAVHDYVNYANMNNVLIGPGRGSAAGSLVNYLLGITRIDPIKYDLSWERFLNEGRVKTFFDESQFV